MKICNAYLILFRVNIALLNACSAATGFMLASGGDRAGMAGTALGVFLLACGSSALNQYQEREIDGLMERTKRRPIPAGGLTTRHALTASLILMLAGLSLLLTQGAKPFTLGLIAVAWYNGVYTWLKTKTAFAAVPGGLVGAVPPVIGWTAAGGDLLDGRLFVLCTLLFLWQVPHFWLLVLRYGDEYREAGLPVLLTRVTPEQLGRIIFAWICATAAATLALPLYGMVSSPVAYGALVPGAVWLVWSGARLFRRQTAADVHRSAFRTVTLFIVLVMAAVSLDTLLA